MPSARQRPGRPRSSSRRGGSSGSSWLLLLVLGLAGAAVFAARTLGWTDDTRAVPATATVVATRAAAAAGPVRTPTTVVQERQLNVATPTPVRARAVPTPTVRAVPTATARPVAVAATAALAQASPTHAAQATPTAGTNGTAAHAPAEATAATSGTSVGLATRATAEATATVANAAHATAEPTASTRATAATVRTGAGSVALTFDAGADRGYAEDILDRLAEDHVVASFGITGAWARANPDLVRRMAADGHLVFNHTLDHRSFTGVSDSLGGLSAAQRRSELDQADAIITPLIGHTTKPFYRLPYGDDDAHVVADVGPDGYTRKIGWTVDSEGWRGVLSQDILARCLKLAAPGAVYVFHVGRASQDAQALAQLIAGLRERGFGFVRVDQL